MSKQQKLQTLNQISTEKSSFDDDFIYGVNEVLPPGIEGQIHDYVTENKKVTLKDKAFFYTLFATLTNSGITTLESLDILRKRTTNPKLKRILNTIRYDVEQGFPLSKAMAKFPDTFQNYETGIIQSGENIGSLDQMLAKLAKQTEDNQKLQQELKGALTYPAVVFCILILTSGVMFGVVVPKLVTLFQDNNIQLPALTQAVLVVSNIMQNYWPILLVIIALLFVAFQAYSQSEDGKFNTDLYKLRVPYFGNILQKYQLINFFSTLGLLMEAGTPIQKSFQILTRVLDNQVYKLKAFEIKARLQNGEKLATIMADTPFLFPDTASKMVEIGEKSATIDKMSLKLSQQYLQEIQYSLKNLTTVLGPIVIVIVGIFVAIFGLAILSPVFQLSQGVV